MNCIFTMLQVLLYTRYILTTFYIMNLTYLHIVPVSKTTRTCTTVLDKRTGDMTELIVRDVFLFRNLQDG